MLIFEIHIPPRPQKQTRFALRSGRAYGIDPSKSDKEQIQWQLRPYAPKDPLEGALTIDITFYLPIPISIPKAKKTQMINGVLLPTKRPDIDNLSYICVNAMKGIVYDDDSQIVDLCLHKRYGTQPKTVIKVIEI